METTTQSRIIENPVIKDRVIFLETAAETKGRYSLLQVELSPTGGNEMHIHKKFDETFTVVKGVLGVQVGDRIIHLQEGETCTAYVGEAHRFFNPSDTEKVTFNVLIQPGSTNFERSLQVMYGLSRDGLTNSKGIPTSVYHLGLLMVWSDTHLPGMGRWMEPILKWAARLAVKKGIDSQLKERYCHV